MGQVVTAEHVKGELLVGWDIDGDHKGEHIGSRRAFLGRLRALLQAGKGGRLFWDGECSVDAFEWWCRCVWAVLDGGRVTRIMVEELADVSPSPGKATQAWGELNRKCRKYGGVLYWSTQKSQEVAKTAYDQATRKYIGYPNDGAKVQHLCDLAAVDRAQLEALEPLEFYRREKGTTNKVKFRYKKPPL